MSHHYDPSMEPRLFDGGDITKRWYIDYRIWDTGKGQFVRKQYTGMNKYPTKTQRMKVAKQKLPLLDGLHRTFNGQPDALDATFGLMYDLKLVGERLAAMEYPGKSGYTIGPPFEFNQAFNQASTR